MKPATKQPHNALERVADAWEHASHRLFSLWDMIQFSAAGIAHNWQWLLGEMDAAHKSAEASEASKPTKIDINRLNGLLKSGNGAQKGLLPFCELLGLKLSKDRIEHFLMILNITNLIPTFRVVHSELQGLQMALWQELSEMKCVAITKGVVDFFEPPALFGREVDTAFPSVKRDIKDAGNCLALDLNTAAVFHLMRTVEFGVRELAKRLNIATVNSNTAITFATLGSIIEAINQKLPNLREQAKTKGDAQEVASLEFFSELLPEMRGFQYAWRDPVMHARTRFDEPHEAENILEARQKRAWVAQATRLCRPATRRTE